MRPSRLVTALVGVAMAIGLEPAGVAFGQAPGGGRDPAAPAPAGPPAPPAASGPAAPAAPPATQATPSIPGEEVILEERPIIYSSGSATWENAFETIVASLKKIYAYLDQAKIAPAGMPMTIYTATDDLGFQFRAAVPVAEPPAKPPEGDLAAGKSPGGKAMKYTHQGSYNDLDSTYEAITNQLDEKGLESQEVFVEVYVADPRTTPEDKLVIEIYVPLR